MPAHTSLGDVLHHDDRGSGAPVVVVGGGPARDPEYLGDLAGLGADFRLIVVHLRGSGRSPLPEDAERAAWWSEGADLEALRQHLGLERLTVLAHSAGTRVALAFAARFPDSVERLVLVTPPASDLVDVPSDVPAIRGRRDGEPGYRQALAALQQGPPETPDADVFNAWQRTIAPVAYARWDAPEQEHAQRGRWTPAAVRAFGGVVPPDSFRADLQRMTAPVIVVAAAEDGIVGAAAPIALAGLFPAGRATVIAGAGHYAWIDRPADFRSAVAAALRD